MQNYGKGEPLNKIQTNQEFEKLFQNEDNTNCYQCGKKSKQWAETKHGIFLCLSCAATYKQVMKVVNVKSIGLDLWHQQQIEMLKAGGNTKFKKFMQQYQLADSQPKVALRSTAANFYRKNLALQATGKQNKEAAPTVEEGKKPYVAEIPFSEMTSQQMMQQAKMRISYVGEKTKYYGTKAFDKVHHKVTSGQLKQDAKKAADKVSKKAKDLWSFLSTKIDEIKAPKTQTKQATQI